MLLLGLRALAITLLSSLAAVVLCKSSLQSACDEPVTGEASPVQLGDHFDESSLLQVNQLVQRQVPNNQRIDDAGATSETPAQELQIPAARPVGSDNLAVVQLKSQKHAVSAQDGVREVRKEGDTMMAITIVVFAICAVVLLLVLFKVFTGRGDDGLGASLKPTGDMPSYTQNFPKPGMHYQRAQGRGSPVQMNLSPSAPASLMPPSHLPSGQLQDDRPPRPSDARSSGSQSPQITPNLISPQFAAIVPESRKFIVKIPSLLESFPTDAEISKKYAVYTQDDIEMFNLKVLRRGSEEYLALCMPSDFNKDLVVCSFYRTLGRTLTCEVYKSASTGVGSKLFGVLQQEQARFSARGVNDSFVFLSAANGASEKLLSILVSGKLAERRVKIFDGRDPSIEVATTIPDSVTTDAYEVECYPQSDVMLVILALAAADRIVSLSLEVHSFGA
mmetsp:Transcript_106048/g.192949  ORF Transcript_106048/g.192949 Transcript_106048/m.192949 type:complete len:447 (+) Transcript_106048:74-1414(+)